MNTANSWWHTILDLFFPRVCGACKQEKVQGNPICVQCLAGLPILKTSNPTTHPAHQRLQQRFLYQEAFSFLYMNKNGMVHELLHQVKYKYRKDLALYLGELLANAVQGFFTTKIDAVIAVPIHVEKIKMRGYNQSFILAACIAKKMNIPFYPKALIKVKNTSSQTSKTRLERIKNLRESIQTGECHFLEGKNVLLVDDVLTTGSTLEACSEALQHIPNMKLNIATLALAGD